MDHEDERGRIEFETPYVLAEAFPERIEAGPHLRRCSQCGSDSQALSAWDLTVIKHRVSNQPLGHLRLYCLEHLAQAKAEWSRGSAGELNGPVCPNCFTVVPSGTKTCDRCGERAV